VRPEVNGKINKLPVDIGDIVKQAICCSRWKITTCKPSENRRNGKSNAPICSWSRPKRN